MKKRRALMLPLLLGFLLLAGCGTGAAESPDTTDSTQTPPDTASATPYDSSNDEKHHVEIDVQDYGTITVELNATVAPETTANFLKLAGEGFYDGLTFHRIISGFMIQGGDPLGNGTGGSGSTIKGEFAINGVENPLSHTRGAISMGYAQGDYDGASSQFFIVHQDSTYLDGSYAAFGYVTEGMEVVDAICENTQTEDSNGTVLAENQPIITSVTVLD